MAWSDWNALGHLVPVNDPQVTQAALALAHLA